MNLPLLEMRPPSTLRAQLLEDVEILITGSQLQCGLEKRGLESGGSNPTSSDSYSDRASARARREAREARLATLTSRVEEDSNRDYKKLYESALSENQKLKTKLQEAQLELADIKSKLEKMAQQKQEKTSDRSSMLEMEKREKRALERKMSEMEEEMKVLTELKSDNQRLKDENGALIRVISKLSK
ncbi:protein phosphatase 1 regulatory subunit 12B-like [Leptonychotes weddellii]|uniref:Protein phosphatase 1 regulatory subunit 12B-like n=1 Tax=Leptonychotes weddellii TaxID=9713 RepID=A0A7F8RPK1_LEPWE|nr:protein phosphatase 1 regulatory subunit 12B-like [Leptonychotes weddellii]